MKEQRAKKRFDPRGDIPAGTTIRLGPVPPSQRLGARKAAKLNRRQISEAVWVIANRFRPRREHGLRPPEIDAKQVKLIIGALEDVIWTLRADQTNPSMGWHRRFTAR